MNIKKDTLYKLPLFTALAAIIIAVPLRVYQYFKILDPETGFYNKIDFSVYLLYIVLGAAAFFGIIMFAVQRKKLTPVLTVKKSTAFLVLSILLAVTVIIDSASQLMSYFDLYEEAVSVSASVSDYVKTQGGSLLLLQAVFGAVTAIYFFISGLSATVGNADGSKLKVLALSPVVWMIFRLLYRFKRTISFINVSDLFLELFEIAFLMLFFLVYAQVVSKIDAPVVFWKLFAYGIPAAMLAIVCFLPRFIVMITGHSELLSPHHGIAYSDFALALFIIYSLISRVKALLE